MEDAPGAAEVLKDIFEDCLEKSPVVVRIKETKYDTEPLKELMAKCKDTEHVRIEL